MIYYQFPFSVLDNFIAFHSSEQQGDDGLASTNFSLKLILYTYPLYLDK